MSAEPEQENGAGVRPKMILDALGNVWKHFNDIGYARLLIEPGSGRSLEQIVEETGAVMALEIVNPVELLRKRVTAQERIS